MNDKAIIAAYCRIRTIDQTIPDEVLDFMKEASIEKIHSTWTSVKEKLPIESDRYLAVVKELNDLGFSYYVWNVYYDAIDNRWSYEYGSTVTHWMPLPKLPNQ